MLIVCYRRFRDGEEIEIRKTRKSRETRKSRKTRKSRETRETRKYRKNRKTRKYRENIEYRKYRIVQAFFCGLGSGRREKGRNCENVAELFAYVKKKSYLCNAFENHCGISTSVVHELPKLRRRVRLPYAAPLSAGRQPTQ